MEYEPSVAVEPAVMDTADELVVPTAVYLAAMLANLVGVLKSLAAVSRASIFELTSCHAAFSLASVVRLFSRSVIGLRSNSISLEMIEAESIPDTSPLTAMAMMYP